MDLIGERSRMMQALLELNCIPVGMELLPAANDSQWQLISRVIADWVCVIRVGGRWTSRLSGRDLASCPPTHMTHTLADCDYYVVVVAGRYGTIDSEYGLSYTEREYDHATALGKPVLAFLHAEPSALPAAHSELAPEAREKLASLRRKLEQRMCRYWRTPDELYAALLTSLVAAIRTNPAPGWIPVTRAMSREMQSEISELRDQNERLVLELNQARAAASVIGSRHGAGYRAVDSAGIVEYAPHSLIDWDRFFAGSDGEIEICFTSGLAWSREHARMVLRRAALHGVTVTLVLGDPESLLPRHSLATEDEQSIVRVSIERSIHEWQRALNELHNGGIQVDVRLELIRTSASYTFYRAGDQMWVTLAPRGGYRKMVPAMRCIRTGTKQGLFDWILDDMGETRSVEIDGGRLVSSSIVLSRAEGDDGWWHPSTAAAVS